MASEERLRRWATGPDNDEVEISVDETIVKQSLTPTLESNANATFNQSEDSFLATIVANTTEIELSTLVADATTVVTAEIETQPSLIQENSTESNQTVELTTSVDLSRQNSTAQGTESLDDSSTSASIQSTQVVTNFSTNETATDDLISFNTTMATVTDIQTTSKVHSGSFSLLFD